MNEAVPGPYFLAAPAQNEIQLHQSPLQVRPVVLLKGRYLTWETDAISSNRFAELVDPQTVQLTLVEHWNPRPAAAIHAVTKLPRQVSRRLEAGGI